MRFIYLKIPLPAWCLFLLFEATRQIWVLQSTSLNSLDYASNWVRTEAVAVGLLVVVAAELYFRATSFYAGQRKLYIYFFGVLAMLGITLSIATSFRPQAYVSWSNLSLRNMLMTHQIAYAAISVWMILVRVAFALAPNDSTRGYIKHASFLAIFAGYDSLIVLVSNLRLISSEILLPSFAIGTIISLCMWFFIKKDDFRTTQFPFDPSRRSRLLRALQTLKELRDPLRGPRSRPPSRDTLVQH